MGLSVVLFSLGTMVESILTLLRRCTLVLPYVGMRRQFLLCYPLLVARRLVGYKELVREMYRHISRRHDDSRRAGLYCSLYLLGYLSVRSWLIFGILFFVRSNRRCIEASMESNMSLSKIPFMHRNPLGTHPCRATETELED